MHRLTLGVGIAAVAFALLAAAGSIQLAAPAGHPLTLAHLATLALFVGYLRQDGKVALLVALLLTAALPVAMLASSPVAIASGVVGSVLCAASYYRYARSRTFSIAEAALAPLLLVGLWLGSRPEHALRLGPASGGRRVR
jgi:uncharacterized membrane protein (UPF0136 family)